MIFSKFDNIRIASIAASVPKKLIDIEAKLHDPEENPKFISSFIKNTGIRFKRKSGYNQTASDFSFTAAKQIMDAGYYKPEEIGVLINITQTPDYRTPSTALVLQKDWVFQKTVLRLILILDAQVLYME